MSEAVRRLVLHSAELSRPRRLLANYRCENHAAHRAEALENLSAAKDTAVGQGNQDLAKAVWCLEMVGHVQTRYLRAFDQLKSGQYVEGWKTLEECEIEIGFLDQHFDDVEDGVPVVSEKKTTLSHGIRDRNQSRQG